MSNSSPCARDADRRGERRRCPRLPGRRRRAGFANSTLARRLSAVRQFHKHLYLDGQRGDDPTIAIEGPRRARPLPKVFTVAEVERLFATAREGLDAPERTAQRAPGDGAHGLPDRTALRHGPARFRTHRAAQVRRARQGAADHGGWQGRQGAARAALRARARGDAALSRPSGRDFARRVRRARGCFPAESESGHLSRQAFARDFKTRRRRRGHCGQAHQPARAAPCFASHLVAGRRGLARCAGPARPRRHIHDADLYPRARRARQGDGARPAPASNATRTTK